MSSQSKRTFGWLGVAIAGVIAAPASLTPRAHAQLWIRQFGTSSNDEAYALAPDGAGGVMVAGITRGSLGGPNAGFNDAFLARYDSAGDQLWIRQFGTGTEDMAFALAPDGAGGVMVAGTTLGSLGGPNAGREDTFLARYDGAGNRLWIRQFGTRARDEASALAPDGAGGVMVAGRTWDSLGGPNAGREDIFLARYDSAGNRLWIRQFGTDDDDEAYALAPDGAGGVIVAGQTWGNMGGSNAGVVDVFLARYDSAGNQLWIHQFGTGTIDTARALAPDLTGGVFVAGYTSGSLGGPNAGGYDAWIARYSDRPLSPQNTVVRFTTTMGVFDVELFEYTGPGDSTAPRTVSNFLKYVCDGDYEGTFFHRLVFGFVLQGGGYGYSDVSGLWNVPLDPPIMNEFDFRRSNIEGTIGMAKLAGDPHSATSQFFFNLADNSANLNNQNGGFTVFGRVINGWQIVKGIERLNVADFGSIHPALGTVPVMPGYVFGQQIAERHLVITDIRIVSGTTCVCYADCDGNGTLDIFDFLCFQNSFVRGEPYACECDPAPACDIFDFLCFQNAFVAGCP